MQAPAGVQSRTVWWFLAACLLAVSAYLFFRSATASYNSVSSDRGYSVQQVACLSVYGWLSNENTQLSAIQAGNLTPDEEASVVACHAAIGDRETTIEVLLGIAVVFAFIGYRAGPGDTKGVPA
jgi:hypothetical protein